MLDVGFSEILLTSAIALIVLGPERLPKVARQVGNWVGRARAMARQLSEQLEREVTAEEFLKAQSKPNSIADPVIAPPVISPPVISPPVAATQAADTVPESAAAPEAVYGKDAASTTAAAMHGEPAADSKPSHE